MILHAAFQLRRARPAVIAAIGNNADETALVPTSDASQEETSAATTIEEQSEDLDRPCSKPRYHVNDNSYVSVTVASSEFQTSMASNDFSSHSTEASAGGGFGGFAASVSGGYAASKSKSDVKTETEFQKTMIAKYMVKLSPITNSSFTDLFTVPKSDHLSGSV